MTVRSCKSCACSGRASHEVGRVVAMTAAWLANLAVAEFVIWRRRR
ncbi:MAG: hypothetical protein WBL06_11720 [Pseudolysinimonas sp.]